MGGLDDNTDCSCCEKFLGDSCFVVLSLMKSTGTFRFKLLGLLEFDGLEFVCMTMFSSTSV